MKRYPKLIMIIVITVIVLFTIIVYVLLNYNKYDDKVPHPGVDYKIKKSFCSCISFGDNNVFSEYDCDSEPTGMPFTGEFYEKYYYNKLTRTIIFKGKGQKDIKAKVLKWTDDTLIIKVLNGENLKRCTIDGKNTYKYVRDN